MFKYQLSAFADESSQVVLEQIAALKKNNVSLIELRGVDGTSVARLTDEEAKAAHRHQRTQGQKHHRIRPETNEAAAPVQHTENIKAGIAKGGDGME